MKVLVLGAGGQLGWELGRTCPPGVDLTALDVPDIDLSSHAGVNRCIDRFIHQSRWDAVINAAAYTAVDRAEQEPETAFQINHAAVAAIADACRDRGVFLAHVSTDFVFSGDQSRPWRPDDRPAPLSVYGRSKLKGEQAVLSVLKDRSLIIRTAWLYSSHGRNFVKTMLDLMRTRPRLTVIDEQVGTPTWAFGLAEVIWKGIDKGLTGVFHYTDAGVASWYDFAVAIQEEALQAGLLETAAPILPISEADYPTPAQRPLYGVLDKRSLWAALDLTPIHWRVSLRSMLKELKETNP